MNKDDCCRIFNVEDIIDLPQAAMNIVMGDRERRDAVYRELLSVNRYDMSFDWFRQLYEEEFAQRKKQKQDFRIRLMQLNTSLGTSNQHVYITTYLY